MSPARCCSAGGIRGLSSRNPGAPPPDPRGLFKGWRNFSRRLQRGLEKKEPPQPERNVALNGRWLCVAAAVGRRVIAATGTIHKKPYAVQRRIGLFSYTAVLPPPGPAKQGRSERGAFAPAGAPCPQSSAAQSHRVPAAATVFPPLVAPTGDQSIVGLFKGRGVRGRAPGRMNRGAPEGPETRLAPRRSCP